MTDACPPLEIDCEQTQRLRASGEPFLLLDCREPEEYATARIDGALLIPLGALQDRLAELESARGQRIVVHCHHGGRSLRAARWLRAQGFPQAQSLAGGIDAWSLHIDAGVPRY